jgi:hypothetical protein
MLILPIGYLGQEINIFLNIVAVVGHMEALVLWLIVLILLETEHGLIWLYHLKLLLIALPEVVAMEEMLLKFINLLIDMVFLNKLVKPMKLKILTFSVALLFKTVWIVPLPKEKNLEIKVIVGHNKNIQYGKQLNLD